MALLQKFFRIIAVPSECWTVTEEQMRRMETAEMRFHGVVAGYKMADHKRNEVIENWQ
jgi:hypothetical protein